MCEEVHSHRLFWDKFLRRQKIIHPSSLPGIAPKKVSGPPAVTCSSLRAPHHRHLSSCWHSASRRRRRTPPISPSRSPSSAPWWNACKRASSNWNPASKWRQSRKNRPHPPPAPPTPAAPSDPLGGGTTLNFLIDTYYSYNFNAPIGRVNRLRAYDVSSNSFSINQAGVVLENAPDPAKGKALGRPAGPSVGTGHSNPPRQRGKRSASGDLSKPLSGVRHLHRSRSARV